MLLLLLLPLTLMADYQSGLDAYNRGDYTTALHDWKAVVIPPHPAIFAETHYAIGMLYWTGQGVTKDYFEASKWMHQAADLNHAGAQAKLGYLYTEGIAVEQNYEQAFHWFTRAARQGNIDGQYNLGIFYLNGWGTPQNKTMAAQYLAAASTQGDESAEQTLQLLLNSTLAPCKSPLAGDCSSSLAVDHSLPTASDRSLPLASDRSSPTRRPQTGSYTWILNQPPNHYTIQVVALRSLAKLQSLTQGYAYLAPFATYTVELKGRPLHVLVQGNYPDVESARRARDNFPRAINRPDRVWIRQFSKIQQLIRAAEQGGNE